MKSLYSLAVTNACPTLCVYTGTHLRIDPHRDSCRVNAHRLSAVFPTMYPCNATLLLTCSGLDTIEKLQGHEHQEVYKLAFSIVDEHFQSLVSCNCCN